MCVSNIHVLIFNAVSYYTSFIIFVKNYREYSLCIFRKKRDSLKIESNLLRTVPEGCGPIPLQISKITLALLAPTFTLFTTLSVFSLRLKSREKGVP